MEKSNEIAHVNAELIPQDNSADSDDKAVSRRRVLEAGAAALAGITNAPAANASAAATVIAGLSSTLPASRQARALL